MVGGSLDERAMKAAREMIEEMEREKAMRTLVRNAFGMGSGINLQRSGLQNDYAQNPSNVIEVPNDKKNGRLRPCMI
jgi:hypothetical protein